MAGYAGFNGDPLLSAVAAGGEAVVGAFFVWSGDKSSRMAKKLQRQLIDALPH